MRISEGEKVMTLSVTPKEEEKAEIAEGEEPAEKADSADTAEPANTADSEA